MLKKVQRSGVNVMEAAEVVHELSAQRQSRSFERDCERLRPLGEAFVLRRFRGCGDRRRHPP